MNIYVGNLPFSYDSAQLTTLFSEFGEVTSAQVISDRDTGRSRGFGFVEMDDEAARKAISELEGRDIDGRRLTVNQAKPRSSSGGGGRSGGGGGGGYGNRSGGGGYGDQRRSSGRW
ncbi:MAG: RNA-binding protein [Acidimicrobiia bacterium]|jgi:RNA recognition motif-containing protein